MATIYQPVASLWGSPAFVRPSTSDWWGKGATQTVPSQFGNSHAQKPTAPTVPSGFVARGVKLTLFAETEFRESLDRVFELQYLPDNWNGNGETPPSRRTVENALRWMLSLYNDVDAASSLWMAPHISASGSGEVTLEWWRAEKKLTVYLSEDGAEFVKVWGADMFDQMEDGTANTANERKNLWKWLVG